MGSNNSTPDPKWEYNDNGALEYTGDGGFWDTWWEGMKQGGREFKARPITTTAQAAMDFHNAGDVSRAWDASSYSK